MLGNFAVVILALGIFATAITWLVARGSRETQETYALYYRPAIEKIHAPEIRPPYIPGDVFFLSRADYKPLGLHKDQPLMTDAVAIMDLDTVSKETAIREKFKTDEC